MSQSDSLGAEVLESVHVDGFGVAGMVNNEPRAAEPKTGNRGVVPVSDGQVMMRWNHPRRMNRRATMKGEQLWRTGLEYVENVAMAGPLQRTRRRPVTKTGFFWRMGLRLSRQGIH